MRAVALLVSLSTLTALGCASKLTVNSRVADVHKIVLTEPTTAELKPLRSTGKDEPFKVGIARELPVAQRRIAMDNLDWRPATGGEFVATISIQSPGARSLRVGVQSQSIGSLKLFFRGRSVSDAAKVQPGVPSNSGGPGIFWSPVVQGDIVWIDVRSPTLPAPGAALEIPLVSHLR
jgi:hypothetical protein